MKSFLDNLQKEVRKPLDEWEAEQARIKAEEEAKKAAEELAKQKEIDHESALVEHELFTIKKAEEKRLAEELQAITAIKALGFSDKAAISIIEADRNERDP